MMMLTQSQEVTTSILMNLVTKATICFTLQLLKTAYACSRSAALRFNNEIQSRGHLGVSRFLSTPRTATEVAALKTRSLLCYKPYCVISELICMNAFEFSGGLPALPSRGRGTTAGACVCLHLTH